MVRSPTNLRLVPVAPENMRAQCAHVATEDSNLSAYPESISIHNLPGVMHEHPEWVLDPKEFPIWQGPNGSRQVNLIVSEETKDS